MLNTTNENYTQYFNEEEKVSVLHSDWEISIQFYWFWVWWLIYFGLEVGERWDWDENT